MLLLTINKSSRPIKIDGVDGVDGIDGEMQIRAGNRSGDRTWRTYLPLYMMLVLMLTLALLCLGSVASASAPRMALNPQPHTFQTVSAYAAGVSAGSVHTCGQGMDGAVSCWGYNGSGRATPPTGTFSLVSAGLQHSCGLRTDGTLACWGNNDLGRSTPPTGTFTLVSAGWYHSCAVRTGGTLACWGSNDYGRSTPPTGTFTQVSAGYLHSCGLKTDGTLACWGDNTSGQLNVPTDTTFIQVSAGGYHNCGVRTDGTLACWGDNSAGQSSPPTGTFIQVSAALQHSCGVRTDGTLACWGSNDYGRATPPTGTFTLVSAGAYHTCGLRTDGTLACWGRNDFGEAPPQPAIDPADLPDGMAGSFYSQIITATGGLAPYSFVVVSGSGGLPPGLTLYASGVLSGIPTAGGTYNFTVQAVDNRYMGATQQYSVFVSVPTPTPTNTPTNTPCPLTYSIQGAITSSDARQRGRFLQNHNPSVCGTVKPCPPLDGSISLRGYDSYTFTNNTGSPRCVTISLTTACAGNNDIYSAAYINSYRSTSLCINYMGDIGYSPGEVGGTSSYTINVPAGATFVVVVHEINPGAGCAHYTLNMSACSVSGPIPTTTSTPTYTSTSTPISTPISTSTATNTPVPTNTRTNTPETTATFTATRTPTGTSTSTPTATIATTVTKTTTPCQGTAIQGSITTADARQRGMIVRDHHPSVCGTIKPCPLLDSNISLRGYDAYSFTNTTGSAQCVTISLSTACAGANDIYSVAYLGSYRSTSLCTNYLGDIGYSPGEVGGTSSYSINVPAGATYVVVVHEIKAGAGCASYTLSVGSCQ